MNTGFLRGNTSSPTEAKTTTHPCRIFTTATIRAKHITR